MNNSIKYFLFFFLMVAGSLVTYAGGSSYSRYGIGDILHYGDSRLYAMGGTGIALLDDGFINGLNPAGLSRISYTRFSGGFEYNRFFSKDESGSALYSVGRLQGLAFAIPISKENGVVLSADATPFSTVNYAINSSSDNSLSLVEYRNYYGSGGLYQLGLGLSVSPLTSVYFGGKVNYISGRIRQYQTSYFNDPSYIGPTFDISSYYSGFTFTIGTIVDKFDNFFDVPFLNNLSLGLTLTTSASLNVDEEKIYPGAAYYGYDSTIIRHGTADLPLTFGIGLSYLSQNRYRFLGDVIFDKWGTAKYFGSNQPELRNSYRSSIGFELLPVKGVDSFWKRVIYRLGFAYNASYYQINGIGINEYLISGGLGLPVGPESRLNIGFQFGLRGSTTDKLQKDNIFRLSIAISASELWFQKYEEE